MTHFAFLSDEDATVAFGQTLAQACKGRGLFTLSGNLGTGKTTLSRGLIQSCGHTGAVKSPTYTLVEPYEIGAQRIYHFDLYRMEDPEELEFIGLRDYLAEDALVLIEWPEKAFGVLPAADIEFKLAIENRGRVISWEAHTALGEEISANLEAAV
jgi:tRNA threonylcarbamoyladenosine biosynthesis protein TsaE